MLWTVSRSQASAPKKYFTSWLLVFFFFSFFLRPPEASFFMNKAWAVLLDLRREETTASCCGCCFLLLWLLMPPPSQAGRTGETAPGFNLVTVSSTNSAACSLCPGTAPFGIMFQSVWDWCMWMFQFELNTNHEWLQFRAHHWLILSFQPVVTSWYFPGVTLLSFSALVQTNVEFYRTTDISPHWITSFFFFFHLLPIQVFSMCLLGFGNYFLPKHHLSQIFPGC